MKLYTEEQVIDFAMSMISQYEFGNKNIGDRELLKESLDCKTPIELLSDEEIKEYFSWGYGGDAGSAIYGAKWLKEQILNQK